MIGLLEKPLRPPMSVNHERQAKNPARLSGARIFQQIKLAQYYRAFTGLIKLSAGIPNISCSFQIIGSVRARFPFRTS